MKIFNFRSMYSVLFLLIFVFGISAWFMYTSVRPTKFISNITPSDLQYEYEDITFTTSDGLTLSAWFIPSNKENAKTIILLHGYPADKGNILPALSFLREKYNLFLFDFRYFGESQGSYSTAGAKEVEDLKAAIRYLKSRNIDEVGVWGLSMGGAVALMAQEQLSEIKVIVAESSYARLDKLIPVIVRWPVIFLAKLTLGIDVRKVSPAESVKGSKIPILIIHSSSDRMIPFSHAQEIQNSLKDSTSAEFWFPNNLLHGQITAEHQQRIEGFFNNNW